MTDQKLFAKCKEYGENALKWRQKFIGLLPEVWRRRLFEKKGFNSIFEFAAKLAGVSQEQVRLVLNLEFRFADKPVLHDMLVSGEASVNKLSRVASIASVENQEVLAEQVRKLSKSALETLVRDETSSKRFEMTEQGFRDEAENLKYFRNIEEQKLSIEKDDSEQMREKNCVGFDFDWNQKNIETNGFDKTLINYKNMPGQILDCEKI